MEAGIKTAATQLGQIIRAHGPGAVACLGGSRSSLETQGGLLRFCRSLGLRDPAFFADPALECRVQTAVGRLDSRLAVSLRALESADFILAVGADPVNEAPMLALALRQAARGGAPVAVLDPRPVSLPGEFEHLPVRPGNLDLALGVLLKGSLESEAAGRLEDRARKFYEALPGEYPGDADLNLNLSQLAAKLSRSQRPVIICGTDIVPDTTPGLAADAALLLKAAGRQAGLFYLLPGPNAFGAALMSQSRGVRRAGRWPWAGPPAAGGGEPGTTDGPANFPALVESMEQGHLKALVLVETDPFWLFPDQERLSRALARLDFLLVLDYLPSAAARLAQVLLPTLAVFERTGSGLVNQEGRLQWAPPVHFGGVPLAQISPDKHPPRTFLPQVPGGDPEPAGEILGALAQDLSPALAAFHPGLWDWLALNQNPLLSRAAAAMGHPEGLRLIPDEQPEQDLASRVAPAPRDQDPPGAMELLLVDWTFGTEELAGYSTHIRQVEEAPRLTMPVRDGARLGFTPGEQVALNLPGGSLRVELAVADRMAPGVLVLPRHRRLEWRKFPGGPRLVPDGAITRPEGESP
jgi:NADH-quinone oxidoreductase subunit G